MKKRIFMLRCLLVCLSVLILVPAGIVSAAGSTAKIKHTPPGEKYIPGFRINLDAQVNDPAGILTARCYFKTKNDKNFAFVKMTGKTAENFNAILPAPFVGSEAVEYLFVSVNNEKKVTRTKLFTIKEGETKEAAKWKDVNEVKEVRLDKIQDTAEKFALLYDRSKSSYIKNLPKYQTTAKAGSLQIGTEISKELVPLKGFYDTAIIAEVPAMAKYGLAAQGLYSSEAIASAGGAGVSGATGAGTAAAISSGAMIGGGIAAVAVVAGGVALASSSSDDDATDGHSTVDPPVDPPVTPPVTPPAGGLTMADLVGTWEITDSNSGWHSRTPYTLNSSGTWSGQASAQPIYQDVNGTWSFNEASQTLTLSESSAGYSATFNAGAINGTSSSFTVNGLLPVIAYTNNSGTSFASQASASFTFTKQ